MNSEEAIRCAAQLIRQSSHAVALTGAGISTSSGIPDFRSPNSGLWTQDGAIETASIFGFKRHPQAFYNWMRPLALTILNADPNPAHFALANLERAGFLKSIITQNIDMLHHRAGSQQVVEVHGHLRKVTCIQCFTEYDAPPFMEQYLASGQIPVCPKCNGVLKPNVILFGEQLPVRELFAARQAARHSDLMLVIGSSLQVAPVGDFPAMVKDRGAHVIVVNYQDTYIDERADILFRDNAAEILPRIVAAVMEEE